MKKFVKRTFASLMVVVLLLTAAPLSGFVGLELPESINSLFSTAVEALTTESGSIGNGITYTFYADSRTLVFRGKGSMPRWNSTNSPKYISRYYDVLERVIIEEGIDWIGKEALDGSANADIYFPKSLRGIETQLLIGVDESWKNVYYAGSKQDWNNVYIEHYYCLSEATMHYNSSLCDANNKYFNTEFNIKVVDETTSYPLSNAKITFNGSNYYTNSNGAVKLTLKDGMSKNTSFTVSSDAYATRTIRFYELNSYGTTIIKLSLNTNFISQGLASVYLNSDTINGPTVSILGKTFPLFSFKGGVNIPLSEITKLNVSTENDTKNKTVKYILGVNPGYSLDTDTKRSDDYQNFKSYYKLALGGSNQKALDKYNSLRRKLKDGKGSLGFDCGITFAGYMEFSYATGNMRLKEGGLIITAEASVSADIPFGGICYATFALGGEVEGTFSISQNSSGILSPSGTIAISVKPTIAAGIKVIMKDLASIEAGIDGKITGKVKVPANSLKNALELTLSAQCYVKAKTLWIFEKKWSTNFPALELYPNTGNFQTNSFGDTVLIDENGNIIVAEEDDFELIDRSYLEDVTFDTSSLVQGDLNDTSVYPYGSPQLVELDDGSTVALFIYDDGTKSDINRTTLYYSVYENNMWRKAVPVCNSGLADFPVEVCTDGEKVYAVWLRASEVYDDTYETEDIVGKTELVYSEFDGAMWSVPEVVDEADKYQMMYSIAEDNGNITVAWAENEQDNYTVEGDIMSVHAKTLSNSEWSADTVICEKTGVTGLSVGYIDGGLSVIYAVDADADVTTTGDSELYINGTQLTSNDVDESEISYQNGAFYWIQDDELYTYNVLSGMCMSTGLALENDYRILTNGSTTAVTYLANDGFTNELMVSYLINGQYTAPVQFTSYGKHITYYDAILNDDDAVSLLADVENLSGDVNAYPYTTTDMVCDIISSASDLEIADVTYDGEIISNSEVSFIGNVINKGTTKVDSYKINFKDASGNIICSEDIVTAINPGETVEFNVSYLIPSDFVKQDVTVEVVAENDSVLDNNSEKITIGYADLEIVDATVSGDGTLTVTLKNSGYEVTDNNKVSITYIADEDISLVTLDVESIGIGEEKQVTWTVPAEYLEFASANVVNKFRVSVTTGTEEENVGNNDYDAVYAPIEVQNIKIDENFLVLEPGGTYKLTPTIEPLNAYNQNVYWVSDSTDIVSIDENGCITAGERAGKAIITAISDDGNYVVHCEVIVAGVQSISDTVIDYENNLMYGFDVNSSSLEGLVELVDDSCALSYDEIYTDAVIKLIRDEEVVAEYTVVIFGDVNGDSWYDGMDAVLVSCLANGMLTKDDVSEAVYMAADCNHDGVIDELDVALLNEAGALLANVDQSKSSEVLLETSSEYVEYISLIDQTPEIEIEDETDVDTEKAPEADAEDSTQQGNAEISFIDMIMNFIKSIFEMLLAYIPVLYR